MVYMPMTYTLSQSLGRCVNFGGDLCSPLYWGWGSCRENLLLLLCLPKWEGIPNMLVKLRRPWYLLTKSLLFCWVFLFIPNMGSGAHPVSLPSLSCYVPVSLPSFLSLPSLLSPSTSLPLLFLSASRIVTEGIGLFSYFLFLPSKESQVMSQLSLPPSILLVIWGHITFQISHCFPHYTCFEIIVMPRAFVPIFLLPSS